MNPTRRFPAGRRASLAAGTAHADPSHQAHHADRPFPPGGTTDVLARALAERLTPRSARPVIVEQAGAGATLGADLVRQARPDGYTLLVGAVHHTIASAVYKKLPYDFQRDFAPLTTIAMVPNVLVVNAASPAKNVADLVALGRPPASSATRLNGNGTRST